MVEEHNTDNLQELNRIISEHPLNEKDTVIKYERLLGQLAPLRAFGDLRFKHFLKIKHVVKMYKYVYCTILLGINGPGRCY